MSHGPRPSRRELFKLVGLVAGVAVVGGSVSACAELDSEQESALIDAWRKAKADIELATSARKQLAPESPEDRALSRVIEARGVHLDELALAIEAAGEDLPSESDSGESGGSSTTNTGDETTADPESVATLDAVVESITSSGRAAREATVVLEGYPAALAGSVGAACSALAKVTLGLSLGRES